TVTYNDDGSVGVVMASDYDDSFANLLDHMTDYGWTAYLTNGDISMPTARTFSLSDCSGDEESGYECAIYMYGASIQDVSLDGSVDIKDAQSWWTAVSSSLDYYELASVGLN
ncbi:hypothetical protein, partial [Gilvimarinus sp. 1_MG-2023]|uniref:hypothetical protein n=1 Tax=Gilvimarinus sp. 1_MG-2023 TaxID=3062638 RepID=UPI0026E422C0